MALEPDTKRRRLLATVAGVSVVGLAGCSSDSGDSGGDGDSSDGGDSGGSGGESGGGDSLTGSVRESSSSPDVEVLSHSAKRTTDQYDQSVIQVTVEFENTGSREKRVSSFYINVDFFKSGASEPIDMMGGSSIVSDRMVAAGETVEVSSNFSFTNVNPSEISRYEIYFN